MATRKKKNDDLSIDYNSRAQARDRGDYSKSSGGDSDLSISYASRNRNGSATRNYGPGSYGYNLGRMADKVYTLYNKVATKRNAGQYKYDDYKDEIESLKKEVNATKGQYADQGMRGSLDTLSRYLDSLSDTRVDKAIKNAADVRKTIYDYEREAAHAGSPEKYLEKYTTIPKALVDEGESNEKSIVKSYNELADAYERLSNSGDTYNAKRVADEMSRLARNDASVARVARMRENEQNEAYLDFLNKYKTRDYGENEIYAIGQAEEDKGYLDFNGPSMTQGYSKDWADSEINNTQEKVEDYTTNYKTLDDIWDYIPKYAYKTSKQKMEAYKQLEAARDAFKNSGDTARAEQVEKEMSALRTMSQDIEAYEAKQNADRNRQRIDFINKYLSDDRFEKDEDEEYWDSYKTGERSEAFDRYESDSGEQAFYDSLNRERADLTSANQIYKSTYEKIEKYKDIPKEADFAQKSIVTETDSKYRDANGQEDSLSLYLDSLGFILSPSNEKPDEKRAFAYSRFFLMPPQAKLGHWEQITEDELKTYYYIYNTRGHDAAEKYLKDMEYTFGLRYNNKSKQIIEGFSGWGKAAASALSVIPGVAGGPAAFGSAAYDLITTGEVNPYSGAYDALNLAQNIRSDTAAAIEKATGSWNVAGMTAGDMYQAGMSGVDSIVGGLTMGPGYTVVMGMNAAASKAAELQNSGASTGEIVANSLLSGVAEAVFEYISLDKILSTKNWKGFKNVLKNVLVQAGIEGSEELFTDIANTWIDALVNPGKTEIDKRIQAYLDDGKSKKEAEAMAAGDLLMDYWKSFAGGAISSFGMSGGQAAATAVKQSNTGNAFIDSKTGMTNDAFTDLVDLAKSLNNSNARALALDLEGSENVTRGNAGLLVDETISALTEKYQNEQGLSESEAAQKARAEVTSILSNHNTGSAFVSSETGKTNDAFNKLVETAKALEGTTASKHAAELENAENVTRGEAGRLYNETRTALTEKYQNEGMSQTEAAKKADEDLTDVKKAVQTAKQTEYVERAVRVYEEQKNEENKKTVAARKGTVASYNGRDVDVTKVDKVVDGEVYFDTGAGSVRGSELEFRDANVSKLVENIRTQDMDAVTARQYFAGYAGEDVATYNQRFNDIMELAKKGNDKTDVNALNELHSKSVGVISDQGINAAYEAGIHLRNKENDVVVKNSDIRTEFKEGEHGAAVQTTKDLNKAQVDAVRIIDAIAKKLHVRIAIVDQAYDKDGSKINGSYNRKTGAYEISLRNDGGTAGFVYVAIHEVSHQMKQQDPEAFKRIQTVVQDTLGTKKWDAAVKYQQETYKYSESVAEEEVVCNAIIGTMSNAADRQALISKVVASDTETQNAFRKLLNRIGNTLDQAFKAITGTKSFSVAQDIAKNRKAVMQLQDEFAKTLDEMSKKAPVTREGGEIRYSPADRVRAENFIDDALDNKGKTGRKRNQERITIVPEQIAEYVNEASGGVLDVSEKFFALQGYDLFHEYRNHSDVEREKSRDQIAWDRESYYKILDAMYYPDVIEMVNTANGYDQRSSFAMAKEDGGMIILVEAVGGKTNPNIVPVMAFRVTEHKWDEYINSGKSIAEMLWENDGKRTIDPDQNSANIKNRVIVARHVPNGPSANTSETSPHSPRSDASLQQSEEKSNTQNETDTGDLSSNESTERHSPKESSDESIRESIKALQQMGKKSVNDFSSEDIQAAEPFARQYYKEMGVKSPFFRAWFGEWRAYDTSTKVKATSIDMARTGVPSAPITNDDTNITAHIGSLLKSETIMHAKTKRSERQALSAALVANADNLFKDAILLDSITSVPNGNKHSNTIMMHSFYGVCDYQGMLTPYKMFVEEYYEAGEIKRRGYEVKKILPVVSVESPDGSPASNIMSSIENVADLYDVVKRFDGGFRAGREVDPALLNEDGTPKIFYHGTDAKFTVFDRSKGRSNMDIQGSFFSPWEIDAAGYGENVGAYYLSISKLAPEGVAYRALNRFKGQNNAGIKAREYLESLGYDGVNNGDEEFIAFYPNQIKSATDNIGTFNRYNKDVRYSAKESTYDEKLFQENERLRDKLEIAKQQVIRTYGKKLNEKGLLAFAKKTVNRWRSGMSAEEVASRIKETWEIINHDKKDTDIGLIHFMLGKIAADIVGEATVETEASKAFRAKYAALLDKVKTGGAIRLSEEQERAVAEIYGSYGAFRNIMHDFGIEISRTGSRSLDDVWTETLNKENSAWFSNDTDVSKRAQLLFEFVEANQPQYEHLLDAEVPRTLEEEVEHLADDLLWGMFDNKIVTFADQKAEEISRLRKEQNRIRKEETAALKESYQQALAELKEEHKGELTRELIAARAATRRRMEETGEKQQLRKRIRKMSMEFRRALTHPSEKSHIPQDLVLRVIELCDTLDISSNRPGKDGGLSKWNAKLLELKAAYDQLKNDPDFDENTSIFDEAISQMIGNLAQVVKNNVAEAREAWEKSGAKGTFNEDKFAKLSSMSLDNLRDIYNIVSAIKTAIKNSEYLINQERKIEASVTVAKIYDEIMAAKGVNIKNPFSRFLKGFQFQSLDAIRFAKLVSGYADNSAFVQLFEDLNAGQRKKSLILQEGSAMFDGLIRDRKALNKFSGANAELIETPWIARDKFGRAIKDKNGNVQHVQITQAMRVSLYLLAQNKDSLWHILEGGLTVPNVEYYNKQDIDKAMQSSLKVTGITQEDLDKLFEGMTEYEKAWADVTHTFFNSFTTGYVNETSLALSGFKKATVENYFPIRVDPAFVARDFEAVKVDGSIENPGWLKERVKSRKIISLEDVFAVVNRSMEETATYAGLAIPIHNFSMVIPHSTSALEEETAPRSIQDALRSQYGQGAWKYIGNLLADLQGAPQRKPAYGPMGQMFSRMRSRFAGTVLSTNLSVTLKQMASYPTAIAELGWRPVLKALFKGGKNNWMFSKADKELINKYTPLFWLRQQGYRDIEVADLNKNLNWGRKMPWLMGWINASDLATVGRLWYASQYYVDRNSPDLKKGSDEYYREVAEIFNSTVEKTQPNYSVMQRPEILRNPSQLVKSLTMFMTQRLQNAGILIESTGNLAAKNRALKEAQRADNANSTRYTRETLADAKEAQRGAVRQWARAVSSQIVQYAVLATMNLAARFLLHNFGGYKKKDEDDEEKYTFGSVFARWFDDFLSSCFGNWLGGSELYTIISSMAQGKKPYDLEVNGISILNSFKDYAYDITKAMNELSSSVTDADKKKKGMKLFNAWENMAMQVGTLLGVPLQNWKNIIVGITNHMVDIANGTFMEADIEGLINESANTSMYEMLFQAYQDNDAVEIEKLRDQMKQEKSEEGETLDNITIDNKIARMLAENDPRIAEIWKNKLDTRATEEAINALAEETAFTHDQIRKAINDYDTMQKQKPSEPKDRKTVLGNVKIYDADDLFEAVKEAAETGNYESADTIYDMIKSSNSSGTVTITAINDWYGEAVSNGDTETAKKAAAALEHCGKKESDLNRAVTNYQTKQLRRAIESGDTEEAKRWFQKRIEAGKTKEDLAEELIKYYKTRITKWYYNDEVYDDPMVALEALDIGLTVEGMYSDWIEAARKDYR